MVKKKKSARKKKPIINYMAGVDLSALLEQVAIDWLVKCKATPVQMDIYRVLVEKYNKDRIPVQNKDVRDARGGHRAGITVHLIAMVEKKILKKNGKFSYIPLGPEV